MLLHTKSFKDLGFVMAQKPKTPGGDNRGTCKVKTYLASDVDALVARLAAPEPEPIDPRWLEVQDGRRYTRATAMERYPQLKNPHVFVDLAFAMARKPKSFKQGVRDVKTYLAADVDALAAERAKKRPRHAPQD